MSEQRNYTTLTDKINQLAEDVKIEALLAELFVNKQLEWKQKRIKTLGLFRRDYRRELDRVELENEENRKVFKRLNFFVWREGLYDSLPKGIFHSLRKDKFAKNIEQIKEDYEIQAQEKKAAQDFFSPIEQEFFNHKTFLELQERDVLSGWWQQAKMNKLARELWNLDVSGIGHEQVVALMFFLPYCFKYKGHIDQMDDIFSMILKTEVTLYCETLSKPEKVHEAERISGLGQVFLGENFVLGDCFTDTMPSIHINVLNLSAQEAADFLPGKGQNKLLNILKGFFLPVEADLFEKLLIIDEDKTFYLGDRIQDKDNFNQILGYTTFL